MDRCLLEGNPHTVIEGMVIGACAIGANQGYIYVRNEYPLAVENLLIAMEQARELGLLGENILGLRLRLRYQGERGRGRFRMRRVDRAHGLHRGAHRRAAGEVHPHRAEGPLHPAHQPEQRRDLGQRSPHHQPRGGELRLRSAPRGARAPRSSPWSGKISNTGLVEVPMGMTLREIIYDIGGGIPDGKAFKAVQTGGPSGGCIPESLIDTPGRLRPPLRGGLDDGLRRHDRDGRGHLHGGHRQVLPGLPVRRIVREVHPLPRGPQADAAHHRRTSPRETATLEQLELLEELAEVVQDTSLCGLGQTAPNPVLSTIRYFEEEYREHIEEKKCRAGVCKALISFEIDPEACTGCVKCMKSCPWER